MPDDASFRSVSHSPDDGGANRGLGFLNRTSWPFPSRAPPQILHANALTTEWDSLIAPQDVDYILGNPPFGGSRTMSAEQKAEVRTVADGIREAGFLDYVTCWYLKSARHIQGT